MPDLKVQPEMGPDQARTFIRRFSEMEILAAEDGVAWTNARQRMDALWEAVKAGEDRRSCRRMRISRRNGLPSAEDLLFAWINIESLREIKRVYRGL
jgi:hypothetical protein